MSVVIEGVIRRKPVLTHASIVCGMLALVNSVKSSFDNGLEKKLVQKAADRRTKMLNRFKTQKKRKSKNANRQQQSEAITVNRKTENSML